MSRPFRVLALVGGPFDGDTMRFYDDQTEIVVPESAEGAAHRYSVAADGRAYFVRSEEFAARQGEGER